MRARLERLLVLASQQVDLVRLGVGVQREATQNSLKLGVN